MAGRGGESGTFCPTGRPAAILDTSSNLSGARRAQLAARERLLGLPALFTLDDLRRHAGLSAGTASVYAHRWANAGLIDRTGPKTGIYLNRVVDPQGDARSPEAVVKRIYPTAVLIGVAALELAGAIASGARSSGLDVAVPVLQANRPRVDGVQVKGKTDRWFDLMAGNLVDRADGIPRLTAEAAVADLLADDRVAQSALKQFRWTAIGWDEVERLVTAIRAKGPKDPRALASAFRQVKALATHSGALVAR